MKKLLIALIMLLPFAVTAQEKTSPVNPLSALLNSYYDIKNALVNSDANTASEKAANFVKEMKAIDEKTLSVSDLKTYNSLKEKLEFDATHISETKDVSHQRDHFSSFSTNMYLLVKAAKPTSNPVFQMYCPMKKNYWLSNEKAVKNPYYGKQMLTCGQVKSIL
ncbi:MAG: DUF3347 domain-containing protein [Bacteroidia bacterium]|nr:DUF3347 domain-containing protein [Bacteroidia bacterium]